MYRLMHDAALISHRLVAPQEDFSSRRPFAFERLDHDSFRRRSCIMYRRHNFLTEPLRDSTRVGREQNSLVKPCSQGIQLIENQKSTRARLVGGCMGVFTRLPVCFCVFRACSLETFILPNTSRLCFLHSMSNRETQMDRELKKQLEVIVLSCSTWQAKLTTLGALGISRQMYYRS